MKNVKYLLMFVTISACLFASEQRVASLGGNVGYWADDDASYTMFPYAINGGNLAQVSGVSGGNTDHNAIVRWGEGTKWGFAWSQSTESKNDLINLQYGNGTYGATFGLSMWADDDGVAETADGCDEAEPGHDCAGPMSSMGFSASYGSNMDFGEIGVGFSTWSKDDGVTNNTADDGTVTADNDPANMSLWFNLRRSQSLWIFDNMLVEFGYASDNDGNPESQTTMGLEVSYYTHINVGANTTALVAAGFGYGSVTNVNGTKDATLTTIALPAWTFAVESNMTDWGTLRCGVTSQYNLSETSNTGTAGAADATSRGGGDVEFSMGLGFNFGGFNMDIDVSENVFTDPVQAAFGQDSIAPTAVGYTAMATLTYGW